jgi:hypothetical protein
MNGGTQKQSIRRMQAVQELPQGLRDAGQLLPALR